MPGPSRPLPRSLATRFGPVAGALLAACQPDHGASATASRDAGRLFVPPPPVLVKPAFCDGDRRNAVVDAFCGDEPPVIGSLQDLQARVGIGADTNPRVVALGLSTSLSGRLVSPINPRVAVLGKDTILTFTRGVQEVELMARDPSSGVRAFYLVDFEQACNRTPEGCAPGDVYTPAIESSWVGVRVRDDADLKNTASDCRQCHQRGLEAPILLMRELDGPWTHFFGPDVAVPDAGASRSLPELAVSLIRDFREAHEDEPYAGISAETLRTTSPAALQFLIDAPQPLVFDGNTILRERWPWNDGYPSVPLRSPTWDASYAAFERGEQLPLPHYAVRPTDPAKQAALTAAYRRYRDGDLPAAELPDLADVYPDDPRARAELGFQIEPDATPAQMLVQACGACHDDVLDQSLSRARFSIALGRLTADERRVAVRRLEASPGEGDRMPPATARQLDDDQRARLVAYLEGGVPSAEDAAFLEHAAVTGMAAPQARGPDAP